MIAYVKKSKTASCLVYMYFQAYNPHTWYTAKDGGLRRYSSIDAIVATHASPRYDVLVRVHSFNAYTSDSINFKLHIRRRSSAANTNTTEDDNSRWGIKREEACGTTASNAVCPTQTPNFGPPPACRAQLLNCSRATQPLRRKSIPPSLTPAHHRVQTNAKIVVVRGYGRELIIRGTGGPIHE